MRITHLGYFKIGTIHGNYNALWTLARAQAARGDEVSIIRIGKPPTLEQQRLAAEQGVRLEGWPSQRWSGFWRDDNDTFRHRVQELAPDVLNLGSVRVPKYFIASKLLVAKGIPYVISLHGGMNSVEMTRKRVRKLAYWYGLERYIHRRGAGIHFVSLRERDDYYANFAVRPPVDAVVANAVSIPDEAPVWKGVSDAAAPRIAYFGRYDPWHKGLDLAAEMVRNLRANGLGAELHLYGSMDKFADAVTKLRTDYADIPLIDHGFLSGHPMYEAMSQADLYIQYSRFEAFGISLIEAMGLGVPAVVSENCDLAPELSQRAAVIQISMNPSEAAASVAKALSNPHQLREIAERGRQWVRSECDPAVVAQRMDAFYQRAIDS